MYKHINPDIIKQNMFNNEDMIKEFIALYRTQTPLDFKNLTVAIAQKDHQQISNAAHHIKPTMEYIGAPHLKEHLQILESSAKELKDFDQIEYEFNLLKTKFNEFFIELEHYEKSI